MAERPPSPTFAHGGRLLSWRAIVEMERLEALTTARRRPRGARPCQLAALDGEVEVARMRRPISIWGLARVGREGE